MSHGQNFMPIVCSSVGIMLFEGYVLGACDRVGLAVGCPSFHVGSDDLVGGADGVSLGSDARGSVMENAFSRKILTAVLLCHSRPSPLTVRSSVGFAKKRAGTVVVMIRLLCSLCF
jgi:hypothetical protein